MKSLTTFGANVSGAAYQGTLPAAPVMFVAHTFNALADGRLQHCMDGRQCAVVPPAGFEEYVRTWPACAPVVADLRGAEASAQKTTATPAAVKKPAAKKKRARK